MGMSHITDSPGLDWGSLVWSLLWGVWVSRLELGLSPVICVHNLDDVGRKRQRRCILS